MRKPDLLPSVFTYSQARGLGLSRRQLRALVDEGTIEKLSRGLYRRCNATPADLDMFEVVLRAPRATLCLTSALARHGLTDTIPSRIDVALPRGVRPPRVGAPVSWHRFAPDTFEMGREEIAVDGQVIGLYDAVRSIVDVFRLGHREGRELAIEALRRWLRRRGAQPSSLLRMARRVDPRSEAPIRRALEILL